MKQYLLSIMKGQKNGFAARLVTYLLLPFSFAYGFGVFCHRNFYRLKGEYKAPKPVISIGNITVGGAGKTPLVVWIARCLQEKGVKPVILTRGYMPQDAGKSDEAQMLNEQVPHISLLAGANRISSIKNNSTMDFDVFLCDDAFQHWPLGRDLNIVVIDALNPFGNGHLLPAGILREPLSALRRADVFVLTKTFGSKGIQLLSSKLKETNPKALIVESYYKSVGIIDVFGADVLPVDFLDHKTVAAFCAIGNPFSFELQIKSLGSKIRMAKLFTFMDHHVYTRDDITRLTEFARSQNIKVLVTTHKDAVKLRGFKDLFAGLQLVYMPIQLEISKGSDEFIQKIISVCRH